MSEAVGVHLRERGAMRVIVETTPLHRPGRDRGLGRYVRAVLEGSRAAGFDVSSLAVRARAGRSAEFRDLLERQLRLARPGYQVFHATTPYVMAVRSRSRTVATILDLIPLEEPGYVQTGAKARLFFMLAARADRVLTLSNFTAMRITHRLGVPPERIVVAPLPTSPAFRPRPKDEQSALRNRYDLHRPYVFALADLRTPDPRKRTAWLSEIAPALAAEGLDLVVAGPGTERLDPPGPRGLGRLTDAELSTLLSGAVCFLSASAHEGQGLPLLEAMSCGTPVVAMSNSSIPEMVGRGGVLVDEPREGSPATVRTEGPKRLADACIAIARDEGWRGDLAREATDAAAGFSAERFSTGLALAYTAGLN
jgi:glycosyltransferase involved in cell wall biosynthesis